MKVVFYSEQPQGPLGGNGQQTVEVTGNIETWGEALELFWGFLLATGFCFDPGARLQVVGQDDEVLG